MPLYLVTVASSAIRSPQHLYLLAGAELMPSAVTSLADQLLHDPVVQQVHWQVVEDGQALTDPFLPPLMRW